MKILSGFTRWLIVTGVVLAIVAGGAYAYIALQATGKISVMENLSWVGDNVFTVSLYPQESEVVELTLANASAIDMDVDIISVITPDPGPKGLVVNVPKKVIVPGNGQVLLSIVITAGKNVEPHTYSVSIDVVR